MKPITAKTDRRAHTLSDEARDNTNQEARVSAQIPREYRIYFHTVAAKANGATDAEIREAVAMSGIVRHWSTVLNSMQVDLPAFKHDVDTVFQLAAERGEGNGLVAIGW